MILKKIINLKKNKKQKKVFDDIIILPFIIHSFIHSFISTNMWRAMCMILFVVVCWTLLYVKWKQKIWRFQRACYDLTWTNNRWSEWAYLSLISVGLGLMLQLRMCELQCEFVTLMMVIRMYPFFGGQRMYMPLYHEE